MLARQGSARKTGLVVAGVMALASAGVIAYFAFVGGSPGRSRASDPTALEDVPPPSLLELARSQAGRSSMLPQASKGLSAQIASKNDPSRLAGRIISASLEPLEAKRYHAEKPQAFIYLKDGRTLYIRADSARLYMPQGEAGQPESGTLRGNVRIGVFAARPDGGEIDPETQEPEVLVSAPGELPFDLTAGEARIPEHLTITSRQVKYAGRDLVILYNQPKERLDLVRVATSEFLKISPGSENKPAARSEAPATPGLTPAAGTISGDAPAPAQVALETFYHAVFQSEVTVTHGQRRVTADAMELWAHLIDNALPAGAIAPLKGPGKAVAVAPGAHAGTDVQSGDGVINADGDAGPAAVTAAAAPTPEPLTGEEEIVITWSGPMEVRPSDQRQSELGADELALRFSAIEGRRVDFSDPETSASGHSRHLRYGATTRELAFTGDPDRAVLSRATSGQIQAPDIRVNLGTGLTTARGAGVLWAVGGSAVGPRPARDEMSSLIGQGAVPADRFIAWKDQADFQFAVVNGAMTGRLVSAVIGGDVLAADRTAFLRAQALRAFFDPVGKDLSVLRRLEASEFVHAGDGRDGALWCDRLAVAMTPRADDPGRSDPAFLTAQGLVAFDRGDSTLEGGLVEADLGLDEMGRTQVRRVVAREDVRFARLDGVRARADELRADIGSGTVDLLGRHAAVASGSSRVIGTQMRLVEPDRTMEVFGPGRFEHEGHGSDGAGGERATAKWTRGMTFDDRSGVLECRGEAVAVLLPDSLSRRTLEADAVTIELTPGPESGADALAGGSETEADAPPVGGRGQDRKVLRARASGSDQEIEGGGPARVEAVRFEPGNAGADGRTLVDTVYLEGSVILADEQNGTLDIPGAGALLVVDRRSDPQPAVEMTDSMRDPVLAHPERSVENGGAPGGSLTAGGSMRGDALFRWTESLKVEREAGIATMRGTVRLIHVSIDGSEQTELESRELVAEFEDVPTPEEVSAADQSAERASRRFTSATATGSVWMRSGGKEITADSMEYDAVGRTVRAVASGENAVTMYDPARPTPVSAKVLFWDLARNRIEIKEPATIVLPR